MRWGAALVASTIDLFRDVDYIFSHSGWRWEMKLRHPRCILCFLMIIWSPSYVYGLFVAVLSLILTTAIMDCRVGHRGVASVYCRVVYTWRSGDSAGMRLICQLWLCQVRNGVFVPKGSKAVRSLSSRLNITLSRYIAVSCFGS
jgi:hypothetical protein